MKKMCLFVILTGISLCFSPAKIFAQTAETPAVASTVIRSPVVLPVAEGVRPAPLRGPGLRMKKTGTTLTILGTAMIIGGVALVSSADDVYYSQTTSQYGTYEEGDPKGALGAVMLVSGAGMTVTGIILWSKGAKKYRRHLEMQEGATACLSLGGSGVSIAYRF